MMITLMMVEWRGMSQGGRYTEGGPNHGHSKVLMMVVMMAEKTRRWNGQDL